VGGEGGDSPRGRRLDAPAVGPHAGVKEF